MPVNIPDLHFGQNHTYGAETSKIQDSINVATMALKALQELQHSHHTMHYVPAAKEHLIAPSLLKHLESEIRYLESRVKPLKDGLKELDNISISRTAVEKNKIQAYLDPLAELFKHLEEIKPEPVILDISKMDREQKMNLAVNIFIDAVTEGRKNLDRLGIKTQKKLGQTPSEPAPTKLTSR